MIHNHEVPSSILGPATRKHSKIAVLFLYIDRQATPRGLDLGVAGRESLLS